MRKTLTSGCSQAAERPRLTGGGGGDPEIFVHVKLSNRELMHSLGISWRERDEGWKRWKNKGGGMREKQRRYGCQRKEKTRERGSERGVQFDRFT